jgi:hypothetical protein
MSAQQWRERGQVSQVLFEIFYWIVMKGAQQKSSFAVFITFYIGFGRVIPLGKSMIYFSIFW